MAGVAMVWHLSSLVASTGFIHGWTGTGWVGTSRGCDIFVAIESI